MSMCLCTQQQGDMTTSLHDDGDSVILEMNQMLNLGNTLNEKHGFFIFQLWQEIVTGYHKATQNISR